MALYGSNKTGFFIKRYPEHLKEINDEIDNNLDVPVDHSIKGIMGSIEDVIAGGLSSTWQQLEIMHNALDPLTAKGLQLDRLAMGGRRLAKQSTVTLKVSGKNGTIIKSSEPFQSSGSITWLSEVDTVITGGSALIEMAAQSSVETVVPAGEAFTFNLSNTDITAAVSIYDTTAFQAEETDTHLAERILSGGQQRNCNPFERALIFSLLELPGIQKVGFKDGGVVIWGDYSRSDAARVLQENMPFLMNMAGDFSVMLDGCRQVRWFEGCYSEFSVSIQVKKTENCCKPLDTSELLNSIECWLDDCTPDCLTPYDIAGAISSDSGFDVTSIRIYEHGGCLTICDAMLTDSLCLEGNEAFRFLKSQSSVKVVS